MLSIYQVSLRVPCVPRYVRLSAQYLRCDLENVELGFSPDQTFQSYRASVIIAAAFAPQHNMMQEHLGSGTSDPWHDDYFLEALEEIKDNIEDEKK
jgi:hypothetical protein